LESFQPDTLGCPWLEQFCHRIGNGSLAPVGKRAHSEHRDLIGRIRQGGNGPFDNRRRWSIRAIFERIGLRARNAAKERGSEAVE
jgi:hypothetical protein